MLTGCTIHGFTVIRTRPVKELGATLYQFRHNATGLEAVWLKRPEPNKTFGIAFKTLPEDDTGVFHILEHSVLCGSERYPVKEPFVELMKSSMNTFLNALTFSDRTFYPISSRNSADFMNLMRVYLDAVFRPLIYSRREIFEQEGWHYELSADGSPSFKGVVYNEMRGLFADADELECLAAQRALFPDTPYRFESGGDPEHIPELSYEGFIDAHRRFYSPTNAYVYLDGDLDIGAALALINGEYLAGAERGERVPVPEAQKPVDAGSIEAVYELPADEDEAGRCRLMWGRVIGDIHEREKLAAAQVLCTALCGDNQSPLTCAVLDAGLAEAVTMQVWDSVQQPWLRLEARNTSREDIPRLRALLDGKLRELAGGLDHARLEAAMANLEFQMRERDYGSWPQGLIFGFSVLDSWMRGGRPEAFLEVGRLFDGLRAKLDGGYFERLLGELFLDNPHRCEVVMLPSHSAGEERRAAEAARLEAMGARRGEGWLDEVRARQAALDAWQAQPDSGENLAKLPRLKLSDVSPEPELYPSEKGEIAGVPALFHKIASGGISYVSAYFDVTGLAGDEISALSFLCRLLGRVDAEHSAEELSRLTQLYAGEMAFSVNSYPQAGGGAYSVKLCAHVSALDAKMPEALGLLAEVLTSTGLERGEDALNILRQTRQSAFQGIIGSGHSAALCRAGARVSAAGAAEEYASGIEFYRWCKAREADWDWPSLQAQLRGLLARCACRANLTLSVTGGGDEAVTDAAAALASRLPEGGKVSGAGLEPWPRLREGIEIPSDVGYAGMGLKIPSYDGAWKLASRAVSLDHLWNAVRVQGGAYGVGMAARGSLFCGFYSYRDPGCASSLAAYAASGGFLRGFDGDVEGLIIGAVSALEPLLTARMKGLTADGFYFRGQDDGLRRRRRRELLAADAASLRRIGAELDAAMAGASVCVLGPAAELARCGLELVSAL